MHKDLRCIWNWNVYAVCGNHCYSSSSDLEGTNAGPHLECFLTFRETWLFICILVKHAKLGQERSILQLRIIQYPFLASAATRHVHGEHTHMHGDRTLFTYNKQNRKKWCKAFGYHMLCSGCLWCKMRIGIKDFMWNLSIMTIDCITDSNIYETQTIMDSCMCVYDIYC